MKGRDRIFLIGVVVLVVLGAGWVMVVSPERKQAADLNTQVAAASSQLATANSQVASGSGAQAQYSAAYASIVSLGKAVPPTAEVPSLIAQIAAASGQRHVEFSSIVPAGSSTGSAAAPTAALTSFTQMPFAFTFSGSFLDLYDLLQGIDRSTLLTVSGGLQVSGRLLTIQGVKLIPAGSSGSASGSATSSSQILSGTITATAYVLPAGQGLTAGATTSAPAGAAPSSTATPASAEASKSPTPPAVARVTP
jgi:Tfp pilus assembly protein PilO